MGSGEWAVRTVKHPLGVCKSVVGAFGKNKVLLVLALKFQSIEVFVWDGEGSLVSLIDLDVFERVVDIAVMHSSSLGDLLILTTFEHVKVYHVREDISAFDLMYSMSYPQIIGKHRMLTLPHKIYTGSLIDGCILYGVLGNVHVLKMGEDSSCVELLEEFQLELTISDLIAWGDLLEDLFISVTSDSGQSIQMNRYIVGSVYDHDMFYNTNIWALDGIFIRSRAELDKKEWNVNSLQSSPGKLLQAFHLDDYTSILAFDSGFLCLLELIGTHPYRLRELGKFEQVSSLSAFRLSGDIDKIIVFMGGDMFVSVLSILSKEPHSTCVLQIRQTKSFLTHCKPKSFGWITATGTADDNEVTVSRAGFAFVEANGPSLGLTQVELFSFIFGGIVNIFLSADDQTRCFRLLEECIVDFKVGVEDESTLYAGSIDDDRFVHIGTSVVHVFSLSRNSQFFQVISWTKCQNCCIEHASGVHGACSIAIVTHCPEHFGRLFIIDLDKKENLVYSSELQNDISCLKMLLLEEPILAIGSFDQAIQLRNLKTGSIDSVISLFSYTMDECSIPESMEILSTTETGPQYFFTGLRNGWLLRISIHEGNFLFSQTQCVKVDNCPIRIQLVGNSLLVSASSTFLIQLDPLSLLPISKPLSVPPVRSAVPISAIGTKFVSCKVFAIDHFGRCLVINIQPVDFTFHPCVPTNLELSDSFVFNFDAPVKEICHSAHDESKAFVLTGFVDAALHLVDFGALDIEPLSFSFSNGMDISCFLLDDRNDQLKILYIGLVQNDDDHGICSGEMQSYLISDNGSMHIIDQTSLSGKPLKFALFRDDHLLVTSSGCLQIFKTSGGRDDSNLTCLVLAVSLPGIKSVITVGELILMVYDNGKVQFSTLKDSNLCHHVAIEQLFMRSALLQSPSTIVLATSFSGCIVIQSNCSLTQIIDPDEFKLELVAIFDTPDVPTELQRLSSGSILITCIGGTIRCLSRIPSHSHHTLSKLEAERNAVSSSSVLCTDRFLKSISMAKSISISICPVVNLDKIYNFLCSPDTLIRNTCTALHLDPNMIVNSFESSQTAPIEHSLLT